MVPKLLKPHGYRPDIDGLRALAVLPVMLFHAGVPGFSGGYIGVDVFFVISGYLITSILLRDLEQGSFSLAKFYVRRALRILPALTAVIAISAALAWWILLPEQLIVFGQSLIAAAFFVSNLFFWTQDDYFAPDAENYPLLHTWSLAVEEQFYVLFPIALWAVFRFGKKPTCFLVSLAALGSFGFAVFWGGSHQSANFFLPITRAWELLAGSVLAFWPVASSRIPRVVVEVGCASGLLVLIVTVALFDGHTVVPGVAALLPIGGTLLLLAFGARSVVASVVLANPLAVGVGLISYSAYLWHQPLLAFYRVQALDGGSLMAQLVLLVISVGLAWATWRWVETPFRQLRRHSSDLILSASVAALALIAILGGWLTTSDGHQQRWELPASVIRTFERAEAPCFNRPDSHISPEWLCDVGARDDGLVDMLVLGDSHMYSLLPAVSRFAKKSGLRVQYVGYPGCPPLLAIHALRNDQEKRDCHALMERAFAYVEAQQIPDVLLVARWAYYTSGNPHGEEDVSHIALQPDAPKAIERSRAALRVGLNETARRMAGAGVRLSVLEQVPHQRVDAPSAYYRAYHPDVTRFAIRLQRAAMSLKSHRALQSEPASALRDVAAAYPAVVQLIDPSAWLCESAGCPIGTVETSYYFDDDHLSALGSIRLSDRLARALLQTCPENRPMGIHGVCSVSRADSTGEQ